MEKLIPFNKPHFTGNETVYIKNAVESGKISGDGIYTKKCHEFFESLMEFNKSLLTTSCTDALEMAAILIGIEPGDEVIIPSYTFVSTANAFILRGAIIRFIDSREDQPGMDERSIESLINEKTKAIVPVHYAGVACDMDLIMDIAERHDLYVIEDAAQAIDSFFTYRNGKKARLGSIGHLAAFSFHETKNIISGEGGLLVVNDQKFATRAEIIREKGTNRSAFFRGEVDKYGWVDKGSSFLPSDIIAAFLYAQLENLESIQNKRLEIWNRYDHSFHHMKGFESIFSKPIIPNYATNNGHMYYLICRCKSIRKRLLTHLKRRNILAVFHYLSLHNSKFYRAKHDGRELPNADKFSDCLVRLPFYPDLTREQQNKVIDAIGDFVNEFH
ncbi:dTDP-4-amino-4,6-dideoxygalactose transaminase [Nonlabens spongiae]|uniref:dTDP-4-amino-4,6-dideoxygalactose transaminase n=1 Tax=Nonlabens spongiae TaxID=331648 RepID=A0A1W6MLR2_9FLAO|nr:dTDP-4-amino-4,6-dideoxygalactose transaminase [Nonlabens spongiae]ARN78512.1 dTDP-4-amino-4,6-dideoxygalactose transaminase [Nonlabens spongiae]